MRNMMTEPVSLEFQSTLSVRRATLALFQSSPFVDISIHALREESDKSPEYTNPYTHISIHALREESDHTQEVIEMRYIDFNPRSP